MDNKRFCLHCDFELKDGEGEYCAECIQLEEAIVNCAVNEISQEEEEEED